MTIDIPSAYPALDSNALIDFQPYDAQVLDGIRRAANRLAAMPAQAFSMVIPLKAQSVGENQAYRAHVKPLGAEWSLLIPPFRIRKKPGSPTMDFRLRYTLEGVGAEFQINTLAQRFESSSRARPGYNFDSTAGTGRTLGFDGVPVQPGEEEVVEVWTKTRGVAAGSVLYTGGSSATAYITAVGPYNIVCRGGTASTFADLDWVVGGSGAANFSTAGYLAQVKSDLGAQFGLFRITGVGWAYFASGGTAYNARTLSVLPRIDPAAAWAIQAVSNLSPWTVTIVEGSTVTLEAFAGITSARTA